MTAGEKATSIRLLDFQSPPMRAFHMTWFAFFLCFFGWFGLAPLMPVIRQGLAATDRKLVPYGALVATFHTGLGCLLGPSLLFFATKAIIG